MKHFLMYLIKGVEALQALTRLMFYSIYFIHQKMHSHGGVEVW